MDKRLLDYDPVTGVRTYHYYDPQTDETHIERTQDVSQFIEINKHLQGTDYQKKGCKESWMHAAMIPVVVQERWLRKFGINLYDPDHLPAVVKLLNDPDWKYLKTGNYRL